MTRIIRNLPFLAYGFGGVLLALRGGQLWGVAHQTAAAAALLATASIVAAHLLVRSMMRARRLGALLDCQDQLLRQIVERLDAADARADMLEERLNGTPDAGTIEEVRGTLQDLTAMLTARAAAAPSPKAAAGGSAGDLVRAAVAGGRVDLHVQTIMRLSDRGAVHAEAFARLRDASGRVVLPGEFLPAAQAAGLTSALDDLQVANCMVHLRNQRRPGMRLFCNIAGSSLGDPSFLSGLVRRMAGAGDLAGSLVFELRADDLRGIGNAARAGLAELNALGFELSIDGYRPGDGAAAPKGARFAKLDADTIIAGGSRCLDEIREAGLEVIATRVESERQVDGLARLGVRFGQGYLFGRPQPARDVALARAA